MSKDKGVIARETTIGILRGLFGAIPFVGTALNEAIFDIRARIHQTRIEDFANRVEALVNQMDQNSINLNVMETPEFVDFLEDTIQKIVKNRAAEKAALFAKLLVSTMRQPQINDIDQRQMYNDVIAELDEQELKILRSLYEFTEASRRHQSKGSEIHMKSLDYSAPALFGVPTEAAKVYFEHMISKGLLIDDSINRIGTRPRAFLIPSPLANSLMDYIKREVAE